MSRKKALRAELDELQAGLVSPERSRSTKNEQQEWVKEFDTISRELHAKFAEVAEGAEDIVSTHPFAAVAAAFLLGVAVGHLVGRAR